MHTEEDCSPSRSSCNSSCVKIYLCSNPEDSVTERRALRESVFPRFGESCRRLLGLDVRVIDPFESNDPSCWPDEITRQQLIEECRECSAGPFLLALVGHQYGTASLPTQVEVSEFQLLLQSCQQVGVSTHELERAYLRDENAVPASYCLRSSLPHTCSALADAKEEDESNMKNKGEELREVFQTAVSLCVQNGLMTSERAHSFYRSALDADIRFALGNCPAKDIINRSVVYVHKVLNANAQKRLVNIQLLPESETEIPDFTNLSTAPTHGKLLSELCDNFLSGLITSCKLLVYTTTTECDHRHGYTTTRRRGYAHSLCQQVYSDLLLLTDSLNLSVSRADPHTADAVSRERTEQEQLCNILSRFYDVIQPEEEKVRAYVELNDQQCPLVVTGGPCTGKTVLLAHCTQQLRSWLPDRDPVVISYYCNLSINASPKCLFSSLCCQIAGGYNYQSSSKQNPNLSLKNDTDDPSYIPKSREYISHCSLTSLLDFMKEHNTTEDVTDSNPNLINLPYSGRRGPVSGIMIADLCLSELEEHLASLLNLLPSPKQPLVLLFDGLDQLESNFGLQIIRSLPSPLPPSVKLILAVSSNHTRLLQAIKLHYSGGSLPQCVSEDSENKSGYVCVQLQSMDRKQCVTMLASLLKSSGRRVTSGQQVLVNQALTSCCLPLYARLLHAHTSLWHSDSDVTEASLPDGVHSSISALLDHLEQKHSSSFVACAVSYITLSRTGLMEAELADLLSNADDVLAEYVCHTKDPTCTMMVPQADVERLLLDLKHFLIKRTVGDAQVLFWRSRHFKLVVSKKYLGTHEVRRKIHSEMADYFSRQSTYESRQPLLVHTASQPCSQPYPFHSSRNVGWVNMRKIVELPHHLQHSDRLEELECGLLMSPAFHQAMVQADLLGDLVAMLETNKDSLKFQFPRERLLLASTLKSCSCFLLSSPLELCTVMENSLLSFLEAFPALEGYVKDIRQERGKRGSGLKVDLCPSPTSVLHIQCLKYDCKTRDVCVTESASTECGVVAEVMDNGSVLIWKGSGCGLVKLSLSFEQKLQFTGVKSSGQFLMLSTQCSKLFVWDVTGPEIFVEVKDLLKKDFESSQTLNKIEGCVACQKKLGMWWKNESFVSVFDICSESLTHFQCQSSVTCLVFSFDCLFCGQEEGTVSIFEIKTRSLLGTYSNSSHNAVILMILCESKQEMGCVDRIGNVSLWDVADKTQPTLVGENSDQDASKNIVNTDFNDEISTLLVCQTHQVTVWDTCNWDPWSLFLAPKGRAFTQAVLAQEGHLFLALLDTSTLVLVWRISSGECVLSLETNEQPHTLLKTASDVICVTQDGSLTVWDSGMIDAAGTAPKMRGGVKEVVVEQTGKQFYTIDGSEKVWMWSLDTGLSHTNFLHDGPVEKVLLSPNCIYLVCLSAGDIYVWHTKTGENIIRIGGSKATDILITPNCNFGVSISKQGLSRVWKMAHGGLVCSIHVYLADAQVSPESTFLIGLCCGDLLAASLWSGSISKRFSCVGCSEHVVSFRTLSEYPDFVVVMVATGSLYTWKVAEETVCQHFQLPHMFHCQPEDFQMSSNGSYALLSTANGSINLLDFSHVKLCSFKAEGLVTKACLDKSGCYVAYIFHPTGLNNSCACDLHTRSVLEIARLSDGDRIGRVRLPKNPSTMIMCDQCSIFVGFEDGSVGVYSVSDGIINEEDLVRGKETAHGKQCPSAQVPFTWFPQDKPNITWV